MKCVTETGFECEVDENVVNDWEFVEILADASEGNVLAAIPAMKIMLSKDGYARLKEHCRDENGKISTERMFIEFTDILAANPKTKN